MISDSITNASPTSAPTARDSPKKKRSNKSAKLKQNKLGLRREQWLSQVAVTNKEKSAKKPVELERREEDNSNGGDVVDVRQESYMESPSNSSMGGGSSSTNFSGCSSSSSCSGNITEEDNAVDDGEGEECVDDWEALADALEAEENESVKVEEESVREQPSRKQAWRPDDDLRPQGLPNLGKQLSFPELDKRYSAVSVPSSCPICYEDLDLTDSSFLPCPCGFRLCLFCHKTICDGDGRCPGCRKAYEQDVNRAESSVQGGGFTIRLARSSSMFCRF
ncbi:unnamed protein product [Eruca vesicaria subsp. sativa]|uniref:RING-type domain-containing protein n=1 Tax=Eruca vesicaria subsp. sativa TaxID=29727 RepID=A0ABC8JXT8_ERUVS|nr:unnamed protein product [Eruca vesicaria subsp. sativa]